MNAPQSYQASIQTTAPADVVFDAITDQMDKWWTSSVKGNLQKLGNHVRVNFPPNFGFWEFRADELQPNTKIVMTCIKAYHAGEGLDPSLEQEWLGTRIIWTIEATANGSTVTMIHDGLTPQLNCFDICFDGWNHFFKNSLKAYLNKDQPTPHT